MHQHVESAIVQAIKQHNGKEDGGNREHITDKQCADDGPARNGERVEESQQVNGDKRQHKSQDQAAHEAHQQHLIPIHGHVQETSRPAAHFINNKAGDMRSESSPEVHGADKNVRDQKPIHKP